MVVYELFQLLAEADARRHAAMPESEARAAAERDIEDLATRIHAATSGEIEIVVAPPGSAVRRP